jgi:anti-anti-sigma factor
MILNFFKEKAMLIRQHIQHSTFEVFLEGDFNFNDNKQFRTVLETIKQSNINYIRLNLEGLSTIDSAALGMLIMAKDTAMSAQKKIIIFGAQGQVRKMIELAHLHTLFETE